MPLPLVDTTGSPNHGATGLAMAKPSVWQGTCGTPIIVASLSFETCPSGIKYRKKHVIL
jgi:hypothetical protein